MSPSRVELSPEPTTQAPPGLKPIPEEKLDHRSDQEIVDMLLKKQPVTSEKNIWAYWHSGLAKMSPWLRRNAIGWVRRLGPAWTVHVLDNVPGSETNARNYLEPELLAESFVKDTMDGPYRATHASDMIRLPLLWKYGGIWMDMGSILFRHVDDICWRAIEDPGSPYEVAGFVLFDIMINGFIACRKGNVFIKRWHDDFLRLWEGGATNAAGFHKKPLLQDIYCIETPHPELDQDHLNDYLSHSRCLLRTQGVVDADFNGPEYYANNVFLIDSMDEMFLLQKLTGFDGKHEFELLSTKRISDGDNDDDDDDDETESDETRRKAEDLVHKVLGSSCLMKLSHGPAGLWQSTLADFWDSEEHADADVAPGSFAAYLRHASVHFDQTRKLAPMRGEAIVNMQLTEGSRGERRRGRFAPLAGPKV